MLFVVAATKIQSAFFLIFFSDDLNSDKVRQNGCEQKPHVWTVGSSLTARLENYVRDFRKAIAKPKLA